MPAVAAEENGTVLVELAPISSVAAVRPTMFAAWAAQGKSDGARIRGIYVSLDGATGENGDELLAEIASSEEGAEIGFLLCIEDADGEPKPYVITHMGCCWDRAWKGRPRTSIPGPRTRRCPRACTC